MKWLFLLLLAVVIFGGAAFFSYDLFVKPQRTIEKEKSGEIPVEPVPDVSLPEFQAAAKLRQEGKLLEARDALMTFMQKFPNGRNIEEAKDLLGQVNTEMLFSDYVSPEKQEYIVRSGDVLAKIAAKTKTTPELIMRTNNLTNSMLRVGQRLLISRPDFSIFIQRKAQTVILDAEALAFNPLSEEFLPFQETTRRRPRTPPPSASACATTTCVGIPEQRRIWTIARTRCWTVSPGTRARGFHDAPKTRTGSSDSA